MKSLVTAVTWLSVKILITYMEPKRPIYSKKNSIWKGVWLDSNYSHPFVPISIELARFEIKTRDKKPQLVSVSDANRISAVFAYFYFFIWYVFGGTYTFHILGPQGPLIWFFSDVFYRLQTQSGFCLIWCHGGRCNVHSPRSTFGATPAYTLIASITAGLFPPCVSRAGSWLRFERAITPASHVDNISTFFVSFSVN